MPVGACAGARQCLGFYRAVVHFSLLVMRALGEPAVLKSAAVAAICTTVACYPRLSQATQLHYPTWYLEALVLLGGMVLWAFVFAWHTKYSHRPVFTLQVSAGDWLTATALGIVCSVSLYLWLDPVLRARAPLDYPADTNQWVAMTLFNLGFSQLFLIFAPFAWLLRLFQRIQSGVLLTVFFGLFVFAIKNHNSPTPFASGLLLGLVAFRVLAGLLAVYFFLRGGVLLVWWWVLLLQCRNLFSLAFHA
jgi:hypothetical protein